MNIQQQSKHSLQRIVMSPGHADSSTAISEASLEKFLIAYGDEEFSFFPTYPYLPKIKYLLWNYENLRPTLKTKIQFKINELWRLTEPAPEAETVLEQPSTADLSNALDEKKSSIEPEQPIHSRESGMTHCSGITRKQDAFDRFLDVVAMLVRAVSFS